jgi:DNA polymerase III gamma/tau subunit
LRLLCRELARATRDLLILSVDPKRASDPDVAADAERERLSAMGGQWSREDLLRAFDLLTKTEQEVRVSDQPRYNLEMAMLRLMHLRKLVPLTDLLSSGTASRVPNVPRVPEVPKGNVLKAVPQVPRSQPAPVTGNLVKNDASGTAGTSGTPGTLGPGSSDGLKEKFLSELKANKSTFYNLVVASAFRIDVSPSGIVFTFLPNQKNAKSQCDEQKVWLQTIAEKVAGRPVPISIVVADAASQPTPPPVLPMASAATPKSSPDELKAEAMANSTVQAVLEIFPVDKTTIEER